MFYVYLLKSEADDSTYIGYTIDLKKRLSEHNSGNSVATKHKRPWELIYYEAYKSQGDAKYREKQLKRHSGAAVALKRRLSNSLRS